MRILVTGAGGLLGGRLAALLATDHETTGLIRTLPAPEGIPTRALDLADEGPVAAALRELRPEVVVHSAALADIEACERDPERAHRENVLATKTLARACGREGARLITISTDLVFGGESPFSSESTPTFPISVYGRTKLAAEAEALMECPDAVVLRIALVVGRGHGPRRSASEAIAQRLARGEEVTLYEDEWRSPVDPESVAEAIRALLNRPGARGCFHIAGSERVSRLELGERVAKTLNLDASFIRRASQSTHQGPRRPKDVSLDVSRARRELGFEPRPLEAALSEGRQP